MKSKRGVCVRLLLWSLVLLLAVPAASVVAQGPDQGGQPTFSQEDLDQMLAPIALYPDDLLVQVLMAATYPLEIVEAVRWLQENPGLTGDQLAGALEQQDWDPSVKSVVNFPSVLQMLNDRLDWTQRLGDAFLAQKDQVMDEVQKLRQRARTQGYLQSTAQESVTVDPQTQAIDIEPVSPQEIYVPVYDPSVVYGPWWWPAYPPYFFYPPGAVFTGGFITFGVPCGLAWGYAWGGFDWHRHIVSINIERNVRFNNRIDRNRYASHVTSGGGPQGAWRHEPAHRTGVAYRTPSVAQQFGRGPAPGASARQEFRGFQPGAGRPGAQAPGRPSPAQPRVASAPAQTRPSAPAQTKPAAPAPAQPGPSAPSQRLAASRPQEVQGMRSPTMFGSGNTGNEARQASTRGHESLSSARSSAPPVSRAPSAGASRGGRR